MKHALKKLRTAFAAATLGLCAVPAMAQDAPAPQTTTATPVTAPEVKTSDLPDLNSFQVKDYLRGSDTRLPLYLCGDNTNSCWSEEERTALDVREFWQMMNVVTLGCRATRDEDLTAAYNTFLTRHEAFLTAQYNKIDAHYIRQLGAERAGKRAHDTLSTTVMNTFASATPRAGFCEGAGQILRHVATVTDQDRLTEIARTVMASSRGTYAPNDPLPPLVRPATPAPAPTPAAPAA